MEVGIPSASGKFVNMLATAVLLHTAITAIHAIGIVGRQAAAMGLLECLPFQQLSVMPACVPHAH